MGSFKATVQTVVTERSITVTVAGFLMQNGRDLCSHLVSGNLIVMGEIDPCKLVSAKSCR